MKKEYFVFAMLSMFLLLIAGGWVPKSGPSVKRVEMTKPAIAPVAPVRQVQIKPIERSTAEPSKFEGEAGSLGIRQYGSNEAGYEAKGIAFGKEQNRIFIVGLKGYNVFLLGLSPLSGDWEAEEFPVSVSTDLATLSLAIDKFGFVDIVGYSKQDITLPEDMRSVGTDDGEPGRIGNSNDIFVIRYNPTLKTTNWIKQWGSLNDWSGRNVRSIVTGVETPPSCDNRSDIARAAATDKEGFTYVAGDTMCTRNPSGTPLSTNGFLIQVSPFMLFHWVREFGTNEEDYTKAIATDADGNIYVGGQTGTNFYLKKGMIYKFNNRGEKLWDVNFGAGSTSDVAGATEVTGIVVDDIHRVLYVTGTTSGDLDGAGPATGNNNNDIFLTKYDFNGNALWRTPKQIGTTIYGTPGNPARDEPTGIALDNVTDRSGIIYVSGYTDGYFPGHTNSFGDEDAILLKFDSNGELLTVSWPKQLGSRSRDDAVGVVVDEMGDVFLTGSTYGSLADFENTRLSDIFVVGYGPDGAMK